MNAWNLYWKDIPKWSRYLPLNVQVTRAVESDNWKKDGKDYKRETIIFKSLPLNLEADIPMIFSLHLLNE